MENAKVKLDYLTNELSELIGNEDLTDEDLREASEGLLPQLCDALNREGYGILFFKIWSNEHQAWWRSNQNGYTQNRKKAGIYSKYKALEIVESANIGLNDVPNEAMIEVQADEPFEGVTL